MQFSLHAPTTKQFHYGMYLNAIFVSGILHSKVRLFLLLVIGNKQLRTVLLSGDYLPLYLYNEYGIFL